MRIALAVPDEYTTTEKGDFFEDFVAELLRPQRLKVTQRVRYTGMEIDVLARDADQPRTLLVECKAHADPLPADVISKALGNAQIRGAEAAWLFSTSDFSKDGRGQHDDISQNPELSRRFAWFSPTRICELLIEQRSVVDPQSLSVPWPEMEEGDWHLLIHPSQRLWLVELIADGVPVAFTAYSASDGTPLADVDPDRLGNLAGRYESLSFRSGAAGTASPATVPRPGSPVAKVTPGDAWEDLRPSRPTDFVGREELITDIARFFNRVRERTTATRSFALQAPSGWGKSSLTLKLNDLAGRGRTITDCSVTAIDSRSATTSAFVAESVRLALKDAESKGFVTPRPYTVSSLHHPLAGPDYLAAYHELVDKDRLLVLIFDQFEELFAKEHLFEAFHAVRELSLDLDAEQYPLVLGFAWKTDVALPQQHPAYHLWHQLSDRRQTFSVPEFGGGEVRRVITKAEKALEKHLSPALQSRLVEQCQGLPWLLKKLLVHVLQRVTTPESQYLLLERELDVEVLFKEDLAALPQGALRCLQYVANAAPVAVTEVEENFGTDTTNLLLASRLVVRSGMNYVVYWDIFRDYLLEGKVPHIPWARTFQRDPVVGVRALQSLDAIQPATAAQIGVAVGLKERPSQNVLSDLVALQLVDRVAGDKYQVATVLQDVAPETIADHARGQLQRHVVAKGIQSTWDREDRVGPAAWDAFYGSLQPRSGDFAAKTVHFYGANLRRWLLFAGLVDRTGSALHRPQGRGNLRGVLVSRRKRKTVFLGTTSPDKVLGLLASLSSNGGVISRADLESTGFRNAIADAKALDLVTTSTDGVVALHSGADLPAAELLVTALSNDPVVRFVTDLDSVLDGATVLGDELEGFLGATWAESSKKRYATGLVRFSRWLADRV